MCYLIDHNSGVCVLELNHLARDYSLNTTICLKCGDEVPYTLFYHKFVSWHKSNLFCLRFEHWYRLVKGHNGADTSCFQMHHHVKRILFGWLDL